MSFFKRLFGINDKSIERPEQLPENGSRRVADNPELFADWVNKYIILSQSFEDDFGLAPNEEQCGRLNISSEERTLCANENVLLRALGACLFVRNNLDEKYYLSFRKALLPPVIERMKRHAPYHRYEDTSKALDQYLEELKSDSHVGFSMTYLDRVYPDCPNSESLLLQGIPVQLGFQYAMSSFEIVRDGFSTLKFGMKYEALEKIHNVLNDSDDQKEKE